MIGLAFLLFIFQFSTGLLYASLQAEWLHSSSVLTPIVIGALLGAIAFGTWKENRTPKFFRSLKNQLEVAGGVTILHVICGILLEYSGAIAGLDTMEMSLQISIFMVAALIFFLGTWLGLFIGAWNLRNYFKPKS